MTIDHAQFAIRQTIIALRHFSNGFTKSAKAHFIKLDLFIREPGFAVKFNPFAGRGLACICRQKPTEKILAARHQKRRIKFATQPSGEARMIRVQMGTHHPVNRPSAHKLYEMFLPDLATDFIADACIDNHPAIFVLQRPKINMIKGCLLYTSDAADD